MIRAGLCAGFAIMGILSRPAHATANSTPDPVPRDLEKLFCLGALSGIKVLVQGVSERDVYFRPFDRSPNSDEERHSRLSVLSQGGVFYAKPGEGKFSIEICRASDNQPLRNVELPADFILRSISPNGEFAIVNRWEGNEGERAAERLKVIQTRTGREVLQLSAPSDFTRGIQTHFLSAMHLFVKLHDGVVVYDLSKPVPERIVDVEITDPEVADHYMKPIPGTSLVFMYNGWGPISVLDLRTLRPRGFAPSTIEPVGETPKLDRAYFNLLARATGISQQNRTFSFERMQNIVDSFAAPAMHDVSVSRDGKLAALLGHQGIGQSAQEGNFESIVELRDLLTGQVIHTLYIPDHQINQASFSPDNRYFAWVGPEGLQVYDMRSLTQPVFSEISRNWLGAYIYNLEWSGPKQLMIRDRLGRITRRDLPLETK